MNILPMLLSAVALVLAAGAFLKALASNKTQDDTQARERDAALREILVGLSSQVASIRESTGQIPSALSDLRSDLGALPASLSGLRSDLSALPASLSALRSDLSALPSAFQAQSEALRTLPGLIARESCSGDLLSEVRKLRESSTASGARLEGIHASFGAASASTEKSLEAVTESVESIGRKLGQFLSNGDASSERVATAVREGVERTLEAAKTQASNLDSLAAQISQLPDLIRSVDGSLRVLDQSAALAGQTALLESAVSSLSKLSSETSSLRDTVAGLPVRTAEEIAMRPAPAPELEELAIAVREAGALRGDSVRSIADAVSRVSDRLEASEENGRAAREDAAARLAQSLVSLESIVTGVRESLAPLGEALRGHGESVLPVAKGLELAQDRLEEAAVSLRANQVEFSASVGIFTSAALDLSTGLGAFAKSGTEEASHDPAAVQQALLEALERLLTGFAESLRATLAESDLRHREALVELAQRIPGSAA